MNVVIRDSSIFLQNTSNKTLEVRLTDPICSKMLRKCHLLGSGREILIANNVDIKDKYFGLDILPRIPIYKEEFVLNTKSIRLPYN